MRTIAIVGGGFCGTMLAILRRPPATPTRLVLIERGPRVGRGVAFAAREFPYLLNVPVGRMRVKFESDDYSVYVAGRLLAQMALDTFAGAEDIVQDLDAITIADRDLEGLQLAGSPPATRLHPHGPYAELGRRWVLSTFSKEIARLAAASAENRLYAVQEAARNSACHGSIVHVR